MGSLLPFNKRQTEESEREREREGEGEGEGREKEEGEMDGGDEGGGYSKKRNEIK